MKFTYFALGGVAHKISIMFLLCAVVFSPITPAFAGTSTSTATSTSTDESHSSDDITSNPDHDNTLEGGREDKRPIKVVICHAKASNGYNKLSVSENSIVGEDDIVGEGSHHDGHVSDIIPPFGTGTGAYPGKNWDVAGKAIYANDCVVPTTTPQTLKVHIYKYVKNSTSTLQVPDGAGITPFPMTATWSATNIGTGTANYVLGNQHGGAAFKYAADTSAMSAPADYTTFEVTGGSVVVPVGGQCATGKYRLVGYKNGNSLSAAQSAPISASAPVYTALTADKYVIVVNENCNDVITTPPPPQTCSVTLVSDTTHNKVVENGNALAVAVSYIHSAWTAMIPGAIWIWGSDPAENSISSAEVSETFTSTFNWSGPVTSVKLNVATDNSYDAMLNGDAVGSSANDVNYATGTDDTYTAFGASVHPGINTLKVTVKNWAQTGGTWHSNPAGLLYKLTVTGSDKDCAEAPQDEYTITGYKWNDLNSNGVLDVGEPKLQGWTITATNGKKSTSTKTNADGYYTLAVGDGSWTVSEVQQTGWTQTYPVAGSNGRCVFNELGVAHDSEHATLVCNFGNHQTIGAVSCLTGDNLLQNASFETPVVTANGGQWEIFSTVANWAISNDGLELWRNFMGSGAGLASAGMQNAELDGNSPSTISQIVATTPGATYKLSFDFSPRAGTNLADNSIDALAGGVTLLNASANGSTNTGNVWTPRMTTFVATSSSTTISFKDQGVANSLGSLIDNTALCMTKVAPVVTVKATKVVCNNEGNLPNWGGGGHAISSTTAAEWVAQSDGQCHVQSGWNFEWGNQTAGDAGDAFIGAAGGGYTTFASSTDITGVTTATIPLTNLSEIHLREVLKAGYIPFTHSSSTANPKDVSAEFYCTGDALNYDNWDFIRNPQAGTQYNCVAFNAPVKVEAPKQCIISSDTSTLVGTASSSLTYVHSAWTTALATGTAKWIWNTATVTNPGVAETVTFTKTFNVNSVPTGAFLRIAADNSYTVKLNGNPLTCDGTSSYNFLDPIDTCSAPVVAGVNTLVFTVTNDAVVGETNPQSNPAGLDYELRIEGSSCSPVPVQTAPTSDVTMCKYSDADSEIRTPLAGWTLTLTKSKRENGRPDFSGTTRENGCVTFKNVPYGMYETGEVMQNGWTNISGLASSLVNSATKTFNIVNHHVPTTGALQITKYLCPATTTVVRSQNGVGGTVPAGCALQTGPTFGYVHGVQTDANGPFPELSAPITPAGSTTAGILIVSNLPANGRYLVMETNASNQKLGAGDILGLYCTGDGDTSNTNDNQELTFVSSASTTHCVAYNKMARGGDGGGGGVGGGGTTTPTQTSETIVVKPSNMKGWSFVTETAVGTGTMVIGPTGQPLGVGSAQLVVNGAGGELLGVAYPGTPFSSITSLGYSTYRSTGTPALAASIQLNIDADATDLITVWQGRLVYEPYYTQTVTTGVWQTWNALNNTAGTGTGNWWFSNAGIAAITGCTQANPCTWAEVKIALPNGRIHPTLGGIGVKAGSNWTGGFSGTVDKFVVGVQTGLNTHTKTYDFEPEFFTLTVQTSGEGHGKVVGSLEDINCSSDVADVNESCVRTYASGTVVTLTATPNEGSNFDSTWAVGAGTCTGNTTPCTVTMTSDKTVNAHFALTTIPNTNSNGGGGGGGRSGQTHSLGTSGGRSGGQPTGEVLGARDSKGPNGEVLGAVAPVGAPNAGEGGADNNNNNGLVTVILLGLLALATTLARKQTA